MGWEPALDDDDPVGRALGPGGPGSQLPPVDRRARRNPDRRRRRRRSSVRTVSPEERERARRELQAEVDRGNEVLARL